MHFIYFNTMFVTPAVANPARAQQVAHLVAVAEELAGMQLRLIRRGEVGENRGARKSPGGRRKAQEPNNSDGDDSDSDDGSDDVGVTCTVLELRCLEEGCPPLETAFAVIDPGFDCKFKVMKPLMEVRRDDVVDSLQAWVRGDDPPCACDFVVPGQGEGKNEGNTAAGGGGGGSNSSSGLGGDSSAGGGSMDDMEAFMSELSTGTM